MIKLNQNLRDSMSEPVWTNLVFNETAESKVESRLRGKIKIRIYQGDLLIIFQQRL